MWDGDHHINIETDTDDAMKEEKINKTSIVIQVKYVFYVENYVSYVILIYISFISQYFNS